MTELKSIAECSIMGWKFHTLKCIGFKSVQNTLLELRGVSISFLGLKFWHKRWFQKRVSSKLKCPLNSYVNFFLPSSLLFYLKEMCYGSEILNACISNKRRWSMVKSQSPDPPSYRNSRWNWPISNFFGFWAAEMIFICKWGRIFP